VTARFDDVNGAAHQTLFDFEEASGQDNIVLNQIGATNTIDFSIFATGAQFMISAVDAIEKGVTAVWIVSVNASGGMTLEKDGEVLTQGRCAIPAEVDRAVALVGEANL
jgi:hypothetical protein